jgi:AGZA family xanthine/uracil permease-like MFS transporter
MTTTAEKEEERGGVDRQLDRFFGYRNRGSSLRIELVAGATTFMTMAYILFLNPSILGAVADPGGRRLPPGAVLTVTALVAAVTTLAMGLWANYPFALAAGLGINGVVAFTFVATQGLSWAEAMGLIVLEGLIITVLVLTGLREAVLDAIPLALKKAIGVGIGLFIAFIGVFDAGFVVRPQSPATPVALATINGLKVTVFIVGLLLTVALVAMRVRAALLLGILGTTVLAIILNEANDLKLWPGGAVAAVPHKLVGTPDFSLVGDFSLFGAFSTIGVISALVAVFAVMLSDFFDTMGTVIGLGDEAGLLDSNGRLPRINRVLVVDSLAAAAGGAASASSNTSYIEAASGIAAGGRTGLTSVVVAAFFALCLFLSPLAGVIPPEATGPALVLVGFFMLTLIRDIDWGDFELALPAFLTIVLMPFTFSITNGVGAGFITYALLKVVRGKVRELHPLLIGVSLVFVVYFAIEPIKHLIGAH